MGHHHYYFTTPHSNTTDDNQHFPYHYVSLIFFLIGVFLVYSYVRYLQSKENYRRGLRNANQGEDEEEDEFPDINNFFPDYLVRNPRNPRNMNRELPPPPPAYEERRNLQELDPPSYESIVNSQSINQNTEGNVNEEAEINLTV